MAPERAAIAGAVVVAHLLLAWAWSALTAAIQNPSRPPPSTPPPLVVRLLERSPPRQALARPPAPQPLADPARRTPARPRESTSARRMEPDTAALQVPQAAALPAAPTTAAAVAASAAPSTPSLSVASAAPAEPASAPLRLELPRTALPSRHPALDDARARTAPASLASRIAQATAADWTTEALGDGRVRYRRGEKCMISSPSRDGALDPFNQAASPKARGSGPC